MYHHTKIPDSGCFLLLSPLLLFLQWPTLTQTLISLSIDPWLEVTV